MPSLIIPPALAPGPTIAFISPSARLNDTLPLVMQRATAVLEGLGYKVRTYYTPDAPTIQSSITNRLAEIRAAFTAPDVAAVICTIGGPSFNELIPALVADTDLHAAIRAQPKIVVGYSDITGLHWLLNATTGLRTFYGPGAIPELGEASDLNNEQSPLAFCVENLFRVIANTRPLGDVTRSPTYAPRSAAFFKDPSSLVAPVLAPSHLWRWLRPGKARGRLFGGCLTVVARLQGVRSIAPDWRGRIVFLETALGDDEVSGNPISRVRAGFADLVAGGVFDEAAGLVVGRPFGYDSPKAQEEYAGVITGLLTEGRLAEKKFPILFNVDIGHTTPMVTLPYNALAELDSEADRFAVLEAGVV